MREKEGGGEKSFGWEGSGARKEALRCGGVFSSWRSALTDARCSVLVHCLLSCQPDYYQGLAVGCNETETMLVSHLCS